MKKAFLFPLAVFAFVVAGCSLHAGSAIPPTMSATSVVPARVYYRSLHDFKYLTGYHPLAGLTFMDGALYGTTCLRKSIDFGSVFRMDLEGHVTTIYSFHGTDGGCPAADLLKVGGNLYGTTKYGGTGCPSFRCGTVFELTKTGSSYSERVIYNFKGGSDGQNPEGGLAYLNGVFYGTTSTGGGVNPRYCQQSGCGTVFSVTPSGKERIVHDYRSYLGGSAPLSSLIVHDGVLYGTTNGGGGHNLGTIFAISTSGKYDILWQFNGYDGEGPIGALVYDKGYLYGTTAAQGNYSYEFGGVVFKFDPSTKKFFILHVFRYEPDAISPDAGLALMNGIFYGTTYYGGQYEVGAVFSITPAGQEHVLYSFRNDHRDGDEPAARLTPVDGTLYGTTLEGGHPCRFPGCGTVFKIKP